MGAIVDFFNVSKYNLFPLELKDGTKIVAPLEVQELWLALSGKIVVENNVFTIYSKTKEETLFPCSFEPISFICFKTNEEALKYFKERGLDITDLSNWIIKE